MNIMLFIIVTILICFTQNIAYNSYIYIFHIDLNLHIANNVLN